MNNTLKAIGAIAVAGLVGIAGVAPASAAPPAWWLMHHQHHFYHRYYSAPAPYYGPRYYYGPGYYHGPGYYYGPGYDPGAAIAGGFIGSIFGAIAGTALSHAGGGGGHVWRCEHHYRTYQPSTNTYMGYDGSRHICRL